MIGIAAFASAIVFAPPVDRAIVLRVSEERRDDRRTVRLSSARTIRFARSGEGYIATIVLGASKGEAAAGANRMFDLAMAALVGVPLRFTLDGRGTVIGSDVAPGTWTRFVDGMAKASDRPGSAAAPMIASLRAAGPAERTRMLGSLLSPILPGGGPMPVPHAPRPIASTARLPTGATIAMTGEDRVEALPGGGLVLTRDLTGSADGVTMRNHEARRIDAGTGLCIERRETTVIEAGGKALTTVRTAILDDRVS